MRLVSGGKPVDDSSRCEVKITQDDMGLLQGVGILLFGPIAHFPSKSNDQKVAFRTGANGHSRVPYIRSSTRTKERLALLSWHYRRALSDIGVTEPPSFGPQAVYVQALFANKPGVWDVHNQPKAACDWLQEIGLVFNDSQIEPHFHKKINLDKLCTAPFCTRIIVMPWDTALPIFEQSLANAAQVALGNLKLFNDSRT